MHFLNLLLVTFALLIKLDTANVMSHSSLGGVVFTRCTLIKSNVDMRSGTYCQTVVILLQC